MFFEETTSTLLCGDLFAQGGQGPAISNDSSIGASVQAEQQFGYWRHTPRPGGPM